MPTLAIVNFNIVCATLGGFITLFGLVSYLLKEKFYLSEALISTLAGVIFSPHATNFVKPLQYANGNEIDLETITFYFTRLVLGVQLVLAGVQLPSKYLRTEWRSLSLLLGPGMCVMWIVTSLLVWALIPKIDFLFALAVGASVTPTDPVLSNSIVKGKFADKNIPPPLQKIIIAESGANDGLGYPFLFLALYLIKYTGYHGLGVEGGAGKAMALWFYETWAYVILMSVAYGALVGWFAKELLHWAEERRYVDRESFLVFAITLALFIVGTVGMLGSDDVLACFIAGNVFTWDDWFRLETMDDSLQPTIDMLLNVAIFMWFGAVCPWHLFVSNNAGIPIYRLIALGILVLLLRRLPMVLAFHKQIHQITELKHAAFVGFFGPIGVSAIFYLYVSREFLREIKVDGVEREDAAHLANVMNVVIWFLVMCSVTVHGLSIPLGKLGLYLPRTLSTARSSERVSAAASMDMRDPSSTTTPDLGGAAVGSGARWLPNSFTNLFAHTRSDFGHPEGTARRGRKDQSGESSPDGLALGDHRAGVGGAHPEISRPRDARLIGHAINDPPVVVTGERERDGQSTIAIGPPQSGTATPVDGGRPTVPTGWQRSIRFGDEAARSSGERQ